MSEPERIVRAAAASHVRWHESYDPPPGYRGPTETGHETVVLAKKLRYDLTAMQAKVTDLLAALGRLDLPDGRDTVECPHCGPWHRGPELLAEHLYSVDPERFPLPAHWATADRLADVGEDTERSAAA